MLERETELIKQIIVESTINGRDAVKLNEIVAAELPRGVKSFMTSQVMTLVEADLRKSPLLAQITKGVVRSLAMESVLSRDEFLKLTEDTVHFLENYLCRPQWTLNNVMFEKSQTIAADEIMRKLELAVEYSYFRILIERHVLRNGVATIAAEEFKALVGKIDQEVVGKHTARELALLAKPIYDFLLFGNASMDLPVPLSAILLFFEDKGMTKEKNHIERMYKVRSRTQISMNELIGILEDLHRVEDTVKEEVEATEREILAPRAATAEPHPLITADDEPAEIAAQATLASAETTVEPAGQKPVEPSTQAEPPAEPPAEPVIEQEQFIEPTRVDILSTRKDNEEHASKLEAMPHAVDAIFFDATRDEMPNVDVAGREKDIAPAEVNMPSVVNPNEMTKFAQERQRLRDAILGFPERPDMRKDNDATRRAENLAVDDSLPVEQRAKFIRRIFKGDENDYGIFINSINTARSWREAQLHLRQLFEMRKLDVLSPDVVEFTDAMHARFNPDLKRA